MVVEQPAIASGMVELAAVELVESETSPGDSHFFGVVLRGICIILIHDDDSSFFNFLSDIIYDSVDAIVIMSRQVYEW